MVKRIEKASCLRVIGRLWMQSVIYVVGRRGEQRPGVYTHVSWTSFLRPCDSKSTAKIFNDERYRASDHFRGRGDLRREA